MTESGLFVVILFGSVLFAFVGFPLLYLFWLNGAWCRYKESHKPCHCKHGNKYHIIFRQRGHTLYYKANWFSQCKICNVICHDSLNKPTHVLKDLRFIYIHKLQEIEYDYNHPRRNKPLTRKLHIR